MLKILEEANEYQKDTINRQIISIHSYPWMISKNYKPMFLAEKQMEGEVTWEKLNWFQQTMDQASWQPISRGEKKKKNQSPLTDSKHFVEKFKYTLHLVIKACPSRWQPSLPCMQVWGFLQDIRWSTHNLTLPTSINSEFVKKLIFLLTGIRKSEMLNEVSSSTPPPYEDNGILFILTSALGS